MKFCILDPLSQNERRASVQAVQGRTLEQWLPHPESVRACAINGEFKTSWRTYEPDQLDEITVLCEPGTEAILVQLIIAAVLFAVQVGLNEWLSPRPGNLSSGRKGKREESFGIAGLSNTIQPIPKFHSYGTRRIWGHIIGTNTDVHSDGKNMAFSVLYYMGWSGGDGYESISDVLINDTPASNFEGVTTETRLGTAGQALIAGFEDITQAYQDGRELAYNVGVIYTSKSNAVNQLKLILEFPGLFKRTSSGDTKPGVSSIKVEFKKTVDPTWVLHSTVAIRQVSESRIFKQINVDMASADQWDVRITELYQRDTSKEAPEGRIFNIVEVEHTSETYPNIVLLAVKGVDASQVQSFEGMQVSALVQGKKVKRWNGASHVLEWTNKRAWIVRDLLTHPVVGGGARIAESMFDDDAALDVQSNYWDDSVDAFGGGTENRDQCDVLINDPRPIQDYVKNLLSEGHAAYVYSEGKIKFIIDKPKTPDKVWASPGNLVDGSVRVSQGNPDRSINGVIGEFADDQFNYSPNVRKILDASIGSDPEKLKSFTFLSIARESQAIRLLTYQLKRHVLTTRQFTWQATRAAQISEPFDVNRLTYMTYKRKAGYSGHLLHVGAGTEIFFNEPVTLEAGKTYDLTLARPDNTTETKQISTGTGTWGKVTVASAFSPVPALGDLWVVGEQNIAPYDVVITDVTMKPNGLYQLTGVNYDAAVHTLDPLPSPSDRRSFRQSQVTPLPLLDARVQEIPIRQSDGSFASKLRFEVTPGLIRMGGVVQEATATTVDFDGTFPQMDDHFNGAEIKISGVKQAVTDYDGDFRKVTNGTAWSPVPTGLGKTAISRAGWTIEDVSSEDTGNLGSAVLDSNTSTFWRTKGGTNSGTVTQENTVQTQSRTGAGTVTFTVSGSATALYFAIHGTFGQIFPTAVIWDSGGSPQTCVPVSGNGYLNVWKIVNPNTGTKTLDVQGISSLDIDVSCFSLSGLDLTHEVVSKFDNHAFTTGTLTHSMTFKAGDMALLFYNAAQDDSDATPTGSTVEEYDASVHGAGGSVASGLDQTLSCGWTVIESLYTAIWLHIKRSPGEAQTNHPHHLTIDLGALKTVNMVSLTQRQASQEGRIAGYQLFGAGDSGGSPGPYFFVQSGVLDDTATKIDLRIPSTTARFLKLVALESWDTSGFAALAEFEAWEPGTTPSPTNAEVEHIKFEAFKGFQVEVSDSALGPFGFFLEAVGTNSEIQSNLREIVYFRFTPISIHGSKNFVSRFILPALLQGDTSPPAPPTNARVVASVNSAVLHWQEATAEDLAATQIYRADFNDSTLARVVAEAPKGNILYVDDDLFAPKTYYYWLASRDTSGNISAFHGSALQADVITAGDDGVAPDKPTGLVLTPSGKVLDDGTFIAEIQADWNDVLGDPSLFGYHVGHARTTPQSEEIIFFVAVSQALITGLEPNVEYEVRVRSVDRGNLVSDWTDYETVTTTSDPGAPAVPTGLTATAFPLAIGLKWNLNAESDVLRYELQRADDNLFTVNVVTVQDSLSLSYVDPLGPGVTMYYRIRAHRRSSAVPSNWSAHVSATTSGINTAELEDAAVIASKLDASSVTNDKLADLVIEVGKLSQGVGGDNVILNSSFESSTSAWKPAMGNMTEGADWARTFDSASPEGEYYMRIANSDGIDRIVGSVAIPVEPGEQYTVRAVIRSFGGQHAGAGIQMLERTTTPASGYISDGVQGPDAWDTVTSVSTQDPLTTTWTLYEEIYTVPAGVRFVSVGMRTFADLNDSPVGFDKVTMHRTSGVKDLRANSVVANTIAALAVIAGKIATNQIGASHLVTGTAVITLAAQIQAALIDTVHIANAAIKTALIDDLQVNTIKIANNAVSASVEALQTVLNLTPNSSWQNIVSVGFIASGGTVLVRCVCYITNPNENNQVTMRFRIRRNSTVLDEYTDILHRASGAWEPVTVTMFDRDLPGSGTHTYYFEMKEQVGTGSEGRTFRNNKIIVFETLK